MEQPKMVIFLAALFCLLVNEAQCSGLSSEGVQFPPPLIKVEGEPLGHLKPYGWQSAPEKPVKEYSEPLPAEEFWNKHVKDHIPLVFRQAIKKSPAIKEWTDEYLAKKYGDLDVLVELKKENRTKSSGRMRIQDFIKIYKKEEVYIVTMLPSEMMPDIQAVPSVLCGTFKNYTHESNLWVSNGGTRSVIHYDADHNLHCMIAGRKDFMMIKNKYSEKLYFGPKPKGVGSGFSSLDPDKVDMNKYPNHAKVPWTWATLYPGDCIFIPSVYIHQVRSYDRSIAVTTLFTADLNESFQGNDCTPELMKEYHSMSEIDFRWTYKKGDPTIDMGFMNDKLVRKNMQDAIKSKDKFKNKDGRLYWKHFIRFGLDFPHMKIARNVTKAKMVFDKLSGEKGYIDMEMANSFPRDDIKQVVRLVESAHGIVTDGTQKVLALPGMRDKFDDGPPNEDEVNKVLDAAKITRRQREKYLQQILEEEEDEDEVGDGGEQDGGEDDERDGEERRNEVGKEDEAPEGEEDEEEGEEVPDEEVVEEYEETIVPGKKKPKAGVPGKKTAEKIELKSSDQASQKEKKRKNQQERDEL
eukprot:gene12097-13347_t